VVSTFTERTQRIINEQNLALMQLSTPVSMLWDDILMLPIVGVVDSKRAQDMMDTMLLKIAETAARVIILDISGVSIIDTAVANHFIKMTKATTLMGCRCVISGISPMIAQTIVSLGIDLAEINTCSTLKDALAFAFAETGHKAVTFS
jgi:rsbT co-antagonist protein RsbR